MIDVLQGVPICIAHHAPLTKRVIENAPDLRFFIVCRGGPVNVNVPVATQHGVLVAFTPARNAAATAEHTIAMILSAMRLIPRQTQPSGGANGRETTHGQQQVLNLKPRR